MNNEINQRIEQIKNGIIPKGYKKTFDGFFPNDWETVRLGDIFKERVEKGREDLPLLSITGNEGVIPRSQISRKDSSSKDKSKYLRICKGDIGYNTMRMWQGVSALSNYEGIVSPAYTVLKPTDGVCTKYFAYLFKTEKNIFKFYRYSQGLVDDTRNLKYNSFKIIQVTIPPVKEQQKIVAILSAQDKVIECYEKKIEQLKRIKKYYLQNMFPKRGETVPKIRFKGFTDVWEQRKLDNLAQFTKGTGYSKGELKESGTPIILYGRLYTKYETVITSIDTFTDAKPDSVYSRGGEVIVPASGETAEDISIASVVEKSGVLLGGDLNIITPSTTIDSAFLAISISNGTPHNNIAKMAQGKSVVHLHNTDLKKIDLSYPCYEEQRQISDFFKRYDNLITLHQRKLEEEKKKKKALQQLLLTGIVRTN